jgi:chloride channel 3/4/5
MSRRASSTSANPNGEPQIPRHLSRRKSALSTLEQGQDEAIQADHAIHEEIAEIKRYEDFTTIDWVQDAAREQLRRRARRQEIAGSFKERERRAWMQRLLDSYEAGQAWIVVSIIGAAIGLNSAFLNIITEWLSDIKLGHCSTAFYLNESFCCWGAESGCDEWNRWSSFWLFNYIVYALFAVKVSVGWLMNVKANV